MGTINREIFWTEPARFDLRRLRAWVERYSGKTKASSEAQRLKRVIEALQDNPRLGVRQTVPDGGSEELRELVVKPYIIRYVVTERALVIIRIWHGKENLRSE